jgi:hypothetical protein
MYIVREHAVCAEKLEGILQATGHAIRELFFN